jgi:3-deoxy-D-manno-octulosonic-acid transferase
VYLLYSLAMVLAVIALSPYFVYQALRHKKYVGSLGQRLGYLPVSFNLDAEPSIWVHAVSVGEVLSVRPVVAELRRRYPALRVFLSTTTMSGQQLARRSVTDVDGVFYFPFDWGFTVRRTLDIVKPRLFVMVEKEIWPNLLRECGRRAIRTVVVSGRVSRRSFPRYRLVRPFFRRVLADVDRFCVQGEETASRLAALGADPARIVITGSLKFDSLDTASAAAWCRPAATTSSSRRSTGSRSSSVRTWRTSPRSRKRFSPTRPRCRCATIASSTKRWSR